MRGKPKEICSIWGLLGEDDERRDSLQSDGELPYCGIQWAHLIWCSCHEVDQDGDDNALMYDDDDGDLPVIPCTLLAEQVEHVLLDVITSCPHAIARPL